LAIGKIVRWAEQIGRLRGKVAGLPQDPFPVWESSTLAREYGTSTLWMRLLGQLTAFFFVPLVAVFYTISARIFTTKLSYSISACCFLLATAYIIGTTFRQRREHYRSLPIAENAAAFKGLP
jgi:hypothetical protein